MVQWKIQTELLLKFKMNIFKKINLRKWFLKFLYNLWIELVIFLLLITLLAYDLSLKKYMILNFPHLELHTDCLVLLHV